MNNIWEFGLLDVLEALKAGKVSKEELNKAYLDRIKRLDKNLNCYLYVDKACEGIPAAIKDVIITKDIPTTAGSKILEDFVPTYNATVIDRLTAEGIGVIGKTNCDEFALGSSGENSAYGPTKNPWGNSKVPGGTSSGSAAAVAADLCTFALGTDTGGSVRQPASLCGVVGLKPSYGRVSRYGSIATASSLDQIGPITKTVGDARLVLEWISGEDRQDSNCVKDVFKPARSHLADIKDVKIGIPGEYFGQGLDSGVEKVVKNAIKQLEVLGARLVEIELPHTDCAIATYYIIMASEVSANLSRYDGIRFGQTRDKFGKEAKLRIMLGTYSLSSGYYDDYYEKAAKLRTLVKQDFAKAYEKCDVICGPVSPTVAWNIGEKIEDPLLMYLSDVYTVPASLAGIPGISVPCGFSDGLPVGLQILGKYMDEETILNVGEVYETATEWHKKKPKL